jgi:NitT/TauT family transport system permease protein
MMDSSFIIPSSSLNHWDGFFVFTGPQSMHLKLRDQPSLAWRIGAGACMVLLIVAVWHFLTRAPEVEERIVTSVILPSVGETLSHVKPLWFEAELSRNLLASLIRLVTGFGLAAAIGVPLGVVCGAWPKIHSFFMPISVFGRNVPVSALVPLTLMWFGTDEKQKVLFIFVACVMFIVYDSANAVADVEERFVQTALTLGATTAQTFFKVLVPLALPNIFGSLRLLFGLAFGYIILAEQIDTTYGAGHLIAISQRRGPTEYVYLTLIAITLAAFAIDRLLMWVQRYLFPYKSA